jgi:hypothetical protein
MEEPLAKYPLRFLVCPQCFLGQLSVVVPPEVLYKDYPYRTGASPTLVRHFRGLAQQRGIPKGKSLDIACNDGTLMKECTAVGMDAWGVDPAFEGERTIKMGWPPKFGYDIWLPEGDFPKEFELITACNVLAHVDNPKDFVAAAVDRLTRYGTLVIEVSYLRRLVEQTAFDLCYHEHLSYFSAHSLWALLKGVGRVDSFEEFPTQGGTVRVCVRKGRGGRGLDRLLGFEEAGGYTRMDTYHAFAKRAQNTIRGIQDVLDYAPPHNALVALGASAKSTVLFSALNRRPFYMVDDAESKHGKVHPTGAPILPFSALEKENRNCDLLLTSWNFGHEMLDRVMSLRPDRNDRAIHYVPRVLIQSIQREGERTCQPS